MRWVIPEAFKTMVLGIIGCACHRGQLAGCLDPNRATGPCDTHKFAHERDWLLNVFKNMACNHYISKIVIKLNTKATDHGKFDAIWNFRRLRSVSADKLGTNKTAMFSKSPAIAAAVNHHCTLRNEFVDRRRMSIDGSVFSVHF